MPQGSLKTSDDLLICTACGTQYNVPVSESIPSSPPQSSSSSTFVPAQDTTLKSCRVCDDPRQFVPPEGQMFTTLSRLRSAKEGYRNVFQRREDDAKVIELFTEPKFGIGQRACIIQTPRGNVMWDMIAYLDQNTVDEINDLGGLEAIIISHPHFYTTWSDWSQTFNCPIYLSSQDAHTWANRLDTHPPTNQIHLLTNPITEIQPGLNALIVGGHFPGSMVLHSSPPNTTLASLFTADAIVITPSAQNPGWEKYHAADAGSGVLSYTFMWSIPNMIPLAGDAIEGIWNVLRDERWEFEISYSVPPGVVLRAKTEEGERGLRGRVLESMKVFLRRSGVVDHPVLRVGSIGAGEG